MYTKIKNFKPRNRIFLAPMLEPNDIAFRLLCKRAGCGLNFNGMINPLSKQNLTLDDSPVLQIFCTNKNGVKEFIKKYEEKTPLFDFNLGCPSALASKMGFGSFLHNKIEAIEEILKEMRESTKKPITIKIRKSENAEKIIKIAEKYVDAIIIHPRTQKQGYSGDPDLDWALKIKSQVNLPVVYSGNVNENNAKGLLKKFDFIMVGREAIGNPNIFSRILNKKRSRLDFQDYLRLAKKYGLHFRQIKYQAMNFTKGRENAKKMREEIVGAEKVEDLERIFNNNF